MEQYWEEITLKLFLSLEKYNRPSWFRCYRSEKNGYCLATVADWGEISYYLINNGMEAKNSKLSDRSYDFRMAVRSSEGPNWLAYTSILRAFHFCKRWPNKLADQESIAFLISLVSKFLTLWSIQFLWILEKTAMINLKIELRLNVTRLSFIL